MNITASGLVLNAYLSLNITYPVDTLVMVPNYSQGKLITKGSSVVVAESEDGTHTVIENEVISTGNESIPPSDVGTDISKQTWDHILASVNPVTSAVPKSQPAQPDNPGAWVYVSMA